MKTLVSIFAVGTLATTMLLTNPAIHAGDILADAIGAVSDENIHQLSNAIELYYSDHNEYPRVSSSQSLFPLLLKEKYIKNIPLNPNDFHYSATSDGQDYSLSVK